MAWQFLESMILSSQWKVSDYTTGNLFKIQHVCSFPPEFSWKYKGLIGQTLNDSDTGNLQLFGDVQQLYFDPPNQFILFNPLNNIDLRRLAIRGYWSAKITFSWIAQIWVWDTIIQQSAGNASEINLTELLTQQQQLLNEINLQNAQILNAIASLPSGGGNANNSSG